LTSSGHALDAMIEWPVDLVIQAVIEDIVSSSDHANMFSSRGEDRSLTLSTVGGAPAAHRLQCAHPSSAAERSRQPRRHVLAIGQVSKQRWDDADARRPGEVHALLRNRRQRKREDRLQPWARNVKIFRAEPTPVRPVRAHSRAVPARLSP
jgi:hypothetical protein